MLAFFGSVVLAGNCEVQGWSARVCVEEVKGGKVCIVRKPRKGARIFKPLSNTRLVLLLCHVSCRRLPNLAENLMRL